MIGDRDNPLTAEIIQGKWQHDKEIAERWKKCKQQLRRRRRKDELRNKYRKIDEEIKKEFVKLNKESDEKLKEGGRVKWQKRGNIYSGNKYHYQQVNRKSEGNRQTKYIAKDWSSYQEKLRKQAIINVYKRHGLTYIDEGLEQVQIKTFDYIVSKWLQILSRVRNKRRNRKLFGLNLKSCLCDCDELVMKYAKELDLGYYKELKRDIIHVDKPRLRLILDSARKTLMRSSQKCKYCDFRPKPRLKVIQKRERRKKAIG